MRKRMEHPDDAYRKQLDWLYSQLPMFTRIGAAAYKPSLANTLKLLAACGNPHLSFKSIHIAGTNGKGSCSSMLASILQEAGYKTAMYTSPHISDFRERILLNGKMIPREFVIRFVEKIRALVPGIDASFFEVTVAMAYSYFAEQQIDIAVIETGLGGLLDSTNVILPVLSIITNISMDHSNLLGNTLAEIATQKAGIIKKGVPVLIGEWQDEPAKIFSTRAMLEQSPLFYADSLYHVVHTTFEAGRQVFRMADLGRQHFFEVSTNLMGSYQKKNVITVLAALDILRSSGWNFPFTTYDGLNIDTRGITGFRGRFDIVHREPMLVLDASHNDAGIQTLFEQVAHMNFEAMHIICGFVSDKDVPHILQFFPRNAHYYFVQASIPRAMPLDELTRLGASAGLVGEAYESIHLAMKQALDRAGKNDLVLVTGSFFILEDAYLFVAENLS